MSCIVNPYVHGGAITLNYITSSTSTATTITVPALAQTGDLVVLYQFARGSSLPATVTPSLFSNAADNSSATGVTYTHGMVDYKKLTGGEPGTSVTGMNGNLDNSKLMLVFRPSKTISTITVFSLNGQVTTGDPTLQTIDVTGISGLTLLIGLAGCNNTASASGTLVTNGTTVAGGSAMLVGYYENQGNSPASRTIDMADLGNNVLQSFGFNIT